jgi:hypothetical protein
VFRRVRAKLAAVWDRARHPHGTVQPFHVWRLFFLCEITGGAALIWINRSVKRGHARQMDVDVLGSVDWAQDMEVGDMGAATR